MMVASSCSTGMAALFHRILLISAIQLSLSTFPGPVASDSQSRLWTGQEQSHGSGLGMGQDDLHTTPVNIDITNATLWRCPHPGQATLKELRIRTQELRLEILAITENWVEVISSDRDSEYISTQLTNCTNLTYLPDLIAKELHGNWETLKHHTTSEFLKTHSARVRQSVELPSNGGPTVASGQVVRRSALETEGKEKGCREGVCAEKVAEKDEWFTRYYNLSDVYGWYRDLAAQHPSMVTLNDSIGKTHYDRDIMAIHITDKGARKPGGKLKVYIQCLLHAREWISGSVCMYLSRYLAAPNPGDRNLAELLKQLEFIIVPVANPDGYYLTWLQYPKYRLWRKNVSPVNGTACAGVDLNRNFDVNWNEADTVADPCSELYGGSSAASEREVQAITSYIRSNSPVHGAIDFHSYYQEVLYPPASTKEDPENVQTLEYVAQWVAAAASQVGEKYSYNKMSDIYLASGTFPDWMLSRLGESDGGDCVIPLTVELRPAHGAVKPFAGFLLPTSEIIPCCQEMVPALVKFSQLVVEKCSG